MVGYHWSLAWWFGADDCNFWCFHTNFYNQNTIISWKLQTISISNSKLWSVIFDTWTLKFTILLPVWSKNSACDTNSPQSWHNPYYSANNMTLNDPNCICYLAIEKIEAYRDKRCVLCPVALRHTSHLEHRLAWSWFVFFFQNKHKKLINIIQHFIEEFCFRIESVNTFSSPLFEHAYCVKKCVSLSTLIHFDVSQTCKTFTYEFWDDKSAVKHRQYELGMSTRNSLTFWLCKVSVTIEDVFRSLVH